MIVPASVTKNEFLNSFAGPKATSLVSTLVILSFLSFGTTINETFETPNQLATITGLAYQSLVVSFGYFVVFGWLVNKFFSESNISRVVALIILFFTTEMFRAVFIGVMLVKLEITQEIDWGYRIVAGGFTGIALFGITAIIVNDNWNYRDNLRELEIAKQKLSEAASVTEHDIKNIRFQILDTIRTAINESLNLAVRESSLSKENSKQVVQELVRISEDVVRPLSHELFKDSFEKFKFESSETNPTISSRRVFELATYVEPFRLIPMIILGLNLLIGAAIFSSTSPAQGLVALITALITFYLIFSFAKKYIQPRLALLPIWLRTFVVTFIYLLPIWLLLNWSFITNALELETSLNTSSYFFALTIVMGWSLAIYPAIKIARSETLEHVKETNEKLSWFTTRLDTQLLTEKKQLASIVHRDVQGKLISSALKFQQEIATGIEISRATANLKNVLVEINNLIIDQSMAKMPGEIVQDLNDAWDGIFTIELSIDQKLLKRISNDEVAKQSISNLIHEFTTNSVKHGKASLGQIDISLFTKNVLELKLKNNGLPILGEVSVGLGTKLVTAQTLSFEFHNLDDLGVEFIATLPIA